MLMPEKHHARQETKTINTGDAHATVKHGSEVTNKGLDKDAAKMPEKASLKGISLQKG